MVLLWRGNLKIFISCKLCNDGKVAVTTNLDPDDVILI